MGYDHYLKTYFLKLCLVPLMDILILDSSHLSSIDIGQSWLYLLLNLIILFSVLGFTIFTLTGHRPVYLVDFSCYQPPSMHCLKMTLDNFIEHTKHAGVFNDSSVEFQRKIVKRSGISDETIAPKALFMSFPPQSSMTMAREEAKDVIFNALDKLFTNNNIDVKPYDIDILVINGGTFSPSPSLSSMIVNKYKMKSNIKCFNLSGMGCSSGVIAIDLANNMLQAHKNSYAIVVTTENITNNWYPGNKKQMLIPNCLFCVGGAAVLLSNWNSDRRQSKYKLVHLVRTHTGANDTAFGCICKARS